MVIWAINWTAVIVRDDRRRAHRSVRLVGVAYVLPIPRGMVKDDDIIGWVAGDQHARCPHAVAGWEASHNLQSAQYLAFSQQSTVLVSSQQSPPPPSSSKDGVLPRGRGERTSNSSTSVVGSLNTTLNPT